MYPVASTQLLSPLLCGLSPKDRWRHDPIPTMLASVISFHVVSHQYQALCLKSSTLKTL